MTKSKRKNAALHEPADHEAILTQPGPDDELLVSYLDGELTTEQTLALEDRLSNEPRLREKLSEMEQAWNLLDELETSTLDKAIVQSTMEMVAVKAEEEIQRKSQRHRQRRLVGRLAAAGLLLALFGAGYGAVQWLIPSRSEQVLRDMPVIERLDQYRQVEEMEFLEELHRQGIFQEETDESNYRDADDA